MNLRSRVLILTIGFAVGFACGWIVTRSRFPRMPLTSTPDSVGSSMTWSDCEHAADQSWKSIRSFEYVPFKTLYEIEWEFCSSDLGGQRVRIMDSGFKKTFVEYHDDSIARVEQLDLLGDHVPQLLVVTESAGTNDRTDWHVFSEANGKLLEWKWPEYDDPAAKLLRSDESFCCKDWNLHLKGTEIFLARGIYRKGDGNCCPSRGGVLVRLRPVFGNFKFVSLQRVSKRDYYRWRSQPFCMRCALASYY